MSFLYWDIKEMGLEQKRRTDEPKREKKRVNRVKTLYKMCLLYRKASK